MTKVQKRTALPHSVTRMGAEISTTGSSLRVSASGIEQSVIDLSRPKTIEFEYLQHMDVLLDMANEAWSIPHLRAFHGGAGACALPLAWEAKHPAMSQVAVEVDPELVEVVGRAAGLKCVLHSLGRPCCSGFPAVLQTKILPLWCGGCGA